MIFLILLGFSSVVGAATLDLANCSQVLSRQIFAEKILVEQVWAETFAEIIHPPKETAGGTLRIVSAILQASNDTGLAEQDAVVALSNYAPTTIKRYMVALVAAEIVQIVRITEGNAGTTVKKVYYRLTPKALGLFNQFETIYLQKKQSLESKAKVEQP